MNRPSLKNFLLCKYLWLNGLQIYFCIGLDMGLGDAMLGSERRNGADKMNDLIKTIQQFETSEAKRYWIYKLKISDTAKGKLLYYFNLI